MNNPRVRYGALIVAALALVSCGKNPNETESPAQTGPIASRTKATEPVSEQQGEPLAATLEGAPGGGMIVQKNVMVAMRDGVRLATDILRPAAAGKYPVVLMRTPYGSESAQTTKRAQRYVTQGYVFVIQDCRGKY